MRALWSALLLAGGCGVATPPAGEDLAMAAQEDMAAAAEDLAQEDGPPPPDLATMRDLVKVTLGCHGMVLCINGCGNDGGCIANCMDAATPTGKKLFSDLLDCLDTACPTINPNDVCFNNTQACRACWDKAQFSMMGACYGAAQSCSNDLP